MDFIERIAVETQRAVTEKWADPSLCILSTAVFVRACDYFEIPAEPVKVKVAAFNPVATEWVLAGRDLDANDGHDCADAGGWILQIDTTNRDTGRYAGHLVAMVDRCLVDANFGQFARPAKAMPLPPVALFDLAAHSFPAERFAASVEGCTIVYQHAPEAPDFRSAPDWSDRKAKPLAGRVIRNIRASLRDAC